MPENIQLVGLEFDATSVISGIDKVDARLKKLETQFNKNVAGSSKLATQMRTLSQKVRTLTTANGKLVMSNERITKANAKLKEDNKALAVTTAALATANKGLTFQVGRLEKKLTSATVRIASLKSKNGELTRSLATLRKEHRALGTRVSGLTTEVGRLTAKLTTQAGIINRVGAANKALAARFKASAASVRNLTRANQKLEARMRKLERSVQQTSAALTKFKTRAAAAATTTGGLGGKVVLLTAAFFALRAAGGALRGLLVVNRDFQQLNAQLIAVTGSTEKASRAFRLITRFAVETPFEVQGITRAFTQLTAVGVPATRGVMRDFGNFAAAFGEDITVFTNAVIRGAAGETEALKRFGVVASVDREKLTVTFRGVTKTVKRNFRAVTQAFRELSQLNFADAMQRQMETIIGSVSNLKDAASLLAFQMGRAGLNAAIRSFTDELKNGVQASSKFADAIGENMARQIDKANRVVTSMIANQEKVVNGLRAMAGAAKAVAVVLAGKGFVSLLLGIKTFAIAHPAITAFVALAAVIYPVGKAAGEAGARLRDMMGATRALTETETISRLQLYVAEITKARAALLEGSDTVLRPDATLRPDGKRGHQERIFSAGGDEITRQIKEFDEARARYSDLLATVEGAVSGKIEGKELADFWVQLAGNIAEASRKVVELQAEVTKYTEIYDNIGDFIDKAASGKVDEEQRSANFLQGMFLPKGLKEEALAAQEELESLMGIGLTVQQIRADNIAAAEEALKNKDVEDVRSARLQKQRFERLFQSLQEEKILLTENAEAALRYKLTKDELAAGQQEQIVQITAEVAALTEEKRVTDELAASYKTLTQTLIESEQGKVVARTFELAQGGQPFEDALRLAEAEEAARVAIAARSKAASDATRAAEKNRSAVESALSSQKEKLIVLRQSSEELERYKFLQLESTEAEKDLFDANQRAIEGYAIHKKAMEDLNEAVKEHENRVKELSSQLKSLFSGLTRDVHGFGDVLINALENLQRALEQLVIDKLVANLTDALLGGFSSPQVDPSFFAGLAGGLGLQRPGPQAPPIFQGQRPGLAAHSGTGGIRDFGTAGTPATLHGREGVFTQENIESMLAASASGGRGAQGGDTVIHFSYAPQINAMDQRGVAEFLEENKGAIAAGTAGVVADSGTLQRAFAGSY